MLRLHGMCVAVIALIMLTTGCKSGGATDFCLVSEPIYASRHDNLTGRTAEQILEHNEIGAKLCGWK